MSHSMNPHPNHPKPEMNTSSFFILQQQAALAKAAEQQQSATVAEGSTSSVVVPNTESNPAVVVPNGSSSSSATLLPPGSTFGSSTPNPSTSTTAINNALFNNPVLSPGSLDHCNQQGGFHDGLMDVVIDMDEDYIDDVSELNSLEGAAFQSRMDPQKMSPEEVKAFPDVLEQQNNLIPMYLYIRNSILKLWYQKPQVCFVVDSSSDSKYLTLCLQSTL